MSEFQHKTTSTLAIADGDQTGFYDIPAMVAQCLGRAGLSIYRLDLGVRGDSIAYETDQGAVTLTQRMREDGVRQIAVACTSAATSGREVGQKLCFQITRALVARIGVASVFWQPTGARVLPEDFTWDAMASRPRKATDPGFRAHSRPAISAVA
ncbi:hypothetical protein [Palleronia abyssalis]|uniref:Uncharacterized protein n=1 Tax=Palleronia abyssalis TaxID=1501240 RepID=A0A2R8BRZ8_9RHOB|nr:hypothetical protein [Palleronia abyssalis]SPJ22922.1 hypothetical protein PAA8504_00721 [Palleronia abyssalis]